MDEIALAEREPELRAGHALLRRARDGDELSRSFAYGVVRGLFERRLTREAALHERALAGAASGAGFLFGAHGESSRSAGEVQHALTWLVSNLADDMPVALVIDDLGWSDPASLAWVAHLVRRAGDLAVAVLATWRTGDLGGDEDLLDRLRTDPATTVVRPLPLTDDGVARLVRETLGEGADPALCETCARASGGNPFLLVELLRSITERGDAAVDAVNAVRPESIERSVQRRLSRLGDAARAAATACAVLGEGGDHAPRRGARRPEPARGGRGARRANRV
jgi:hypothetical protein